MEKEKLLQAATGWSQNSTRARPDTSILIICLLDIHMLSKGEKECSEQRMH